MLRLGILFRKTLLLIVSMTFCLVVLDGALWLVHPLPSGLSARFVIPTDFPGLKQQVLFEKYYDLRGLSWTEKSSLKKPTGTVRILCVGASTTESTQQSPQDAWWGLLEKKLRQQPESAGKSVQVLAFGQGGFEVSDDLAYLRAELTELNP